MNAIKQVFILIPTVAFFCFGCANGNSGAATGIENSRDPGMTDSRNDALEKQNESRGK